MANIMARRTGLRLMLACGLLLASAPAPAAEQTLGVTSFDHIRVEGPYRVLVVTGRGASAKAEGDRRALDRLSVRVEGRTLLIRANSAAWGGWDGEGQGPVTITVSTPALQSARVIGGAQLSVDRMKGARLDLSLDGAGELAIGSVETDRLNVAINGAGRVALSGRGAAVQAVVRGSGTLDAPDLTAADLQLVVEGAAGARLAATRSARITSASAGAVTVTGKPACTVRQTGAGRVACGAPEKRRAAGNPCVKSMDSRRMGVKFARAL